MISTRVGNGLTRIALPAAFLSLGDAVIGGVILHHPRPDLIGTIAFMILVPTVCAQLACVPWMLVEGWLERRRQIKHPTASVPMFYGTVGLSHQVYGDTLPADPDCSNTFGWRCWIWSVRERQLYSPIQRTLWEGTELRAPLWSDNGAVRGHAGIHAHLVPRDWAHHNCPEHPFTLRDERIWWMNADGGAIEGILIDGVVERFDRYVLGAQGWRAEWVIVRKLRAPNQELGLQLEQIFPDVEIVYPTGGVPIGGYLSIGA